MASSTEDKIEYVQKWLEDISWQEELDLQNDKDIFDELFEMAQSSRLKEKKMSTIINEIEIQSTEYNNKAGEISALLKSMGLTYKDLPPITQLQLDLLAETTYNLSLGEPTPSYISLGMSALLKKEARLKHELNKLKQTLKHTNVELEKSLVDKDHFTKITEELLGSIVEGASKERDKTKRFLDEKSQQYTKLIQSLQTELNDSGYSEDHSHGELIKFHKEVQELEKQVKKLTEQLKHFTDLPPDLALAKVKLEEAKQEMELLENELSQKIDLVSAEI